MQMPSLLTRIAGIAALAMAGFAPAVPGDADVPTVPTVDLQRYAGTWYEQARLPNRFQKQCHREVSATYTPQADGSVEVLNRCLRENGTSDSAVGKAEVDDPRQPGLLDVTFMPKGLRWLPFTQAEYRIVALDDDYQWSIVGGKDRKYLWVLTRRQNIDAAQREALVDRARALGYDTTKLQFSRVY
ncbi:MAG TPA: lipocalin family protein [Tahibacter sp.]|uniref:lipocalin family protein n=1 Tax=Tahibacter sp. TaxID=2056211 RepID=UPI002BC50561|nr:lipocalin family protein [Tahibacter sp.]HSX62756.1 lipocalin family protein [Tahibacter sp.]